MKKFYVINGPVRGMDGKQCQNGEEICLEGCDPRNIDTLVKAKKIEARDGAAKPESKLKAKS